MVPDFHPLSLELFHDHEMFICMTNNSDVNVDSVQGHSITKNDIVHCLAAIYIHQEVS